MQTYKMIGAGGTGTHLLPAMLAYLRAHHENEGSEYQVVIADGDIFEPKNARAGALFGISLDIQLLLGLILAIISPLMQAAYQDLAGLAMQAPFRTFLMEHMPIMFVALILVHVGSAAARKGADDGARHRRAALWFSVALLLIAVAIPWSRPLFRL